MTVEQAPHEALSDFAIDDAKRDFSTVAHDFRVRMKSGDLGSLPAILAILVLVVVFGLARPESFLTALNLANFLEQAAGIIVIAMAVSFVLLLGEIDLAAGFTAGVAAAVLATRLEAGWGLIAAVIVSGAVALALGLWTGVLVAKLGIPSFVVTLANFLVFQGILLLLVEDGGSVRINDPIIRGIVGNNLSPVMSWLLGFVAVAIYAFVEIYKQKRSDGATPWSIVIVKVAVAGVLTAALIALLNRNRAFASATGEIRGLPYVVPLVLIIMIGLTFLLNRTRYGRHLMAVGGNAEAARRAGINVVRVRLSAFTLCGLLAGIGGAFLASRVNSVDPNTGGNDTLLLAVGAAVIGGTSLFGGHGRMLNAVLGGLVLALIPNGLTLLGTMNPFGFQVQFGSAGVKFICAGLALMLAASVDALSRKRTT